MSKNISGHDFETFLVSTPISPPLYSVNLVLEAAWSPQSLVFAGTAISFRQLRKVYIKLFGMSTGHQPKKMTLRVLLVHKHEDGGDCPQPPPLCSGGVFGEFVLSLFFRIS